ncbi:hypothetical protein GN958_ATG05732 [Phytophthora infestans]|uniref:Uncharacterized protein n=1 Tax=Phytophthora infestans TaxID=4787 RepID=A0A8S9UVG2_PHYIN|nr:hypothetical protein GN958_ATG05732 [Phytophthora infestans]
MIKPTTDVSWDVEVSAKTGRPIRWNGQNFQCFENVMKLAARKKDTDLYKVMTQQVKYETSFTSLQKSAWNGWQLGLQELIFSSNNNVEGYLNYTYRLHSRPRTVGRTLSDAVLSGMLVSSLPFKERFNRLRGYLDTGMDCAENQMNWSFGSGKESPNQSHNAKNRNSRKRNVTMKNTSVLGTVSGATTLGTQSETV